MVVARQRPRALARPDRRPAMNSRAVMDRRPSGWTTSTRRSPPSPHATETTPPSVATISPGTARVDSRCVGGDGRHADGGPKHDQALALEQGARMRPWVKAPDVVVDPAVPATASR